MEAAPTSVPILSAVLSAYATKGTNWLRMDSPALVSESCLSTYSSQFLSTECLKPAHLRQLYKEFCFNYAHIYVFAFLQ